MRRLIVLGAAALSLIPLGVHAQTVERPKPAPNMSAKPMTPAPPAMTEVPPSTSPTPTMTVGEKVAADWSRYDLGAKGHLTKAELSRWLTDLRSANGESAPDDKWLAAAFAQTDTNKDQKVSREELTASLSSGR